MSHILRTALERNRLELFSQLSRAAVFKESMSRTNDIEPEDDSVLNNSTNLAVELRHPQPQSEEKNYLNSKEKRTM